MFLIYEVLCNLFSSNSEFFLLVFSSSINFRPHNKTQDVILNLASKYWISNNCVKQKEKIDVHHALSKLFSSLCWFFLLKTNLAVSVNNVTIEEKNIEFGKNIYICGYFGYNFSEHAGEISSLCDKLSCNIPTIKTDQNTTLDKFIFSLWIRHNRIETAKIIADFTKNIKSFLNLLKKDKIKEELSTH